jgi:hypothetical protein
MLTSPGIAETYACVMNTGNTLPKSYQLMGYKNTLPTVKRQIRLAENPTPAVANMMEAARVDTTILLDYLTSKVALEEPEIGRNHPNI